MINLVDLAGSEKVLRQVDGSHAKLDLALCFALHGSNISNDRRKLLILKMQYVTLGVFCIELSEVKQTGAEGERMKEGAMINKSLSLGVHLALGQIQTHDGMTLSGVFGYNKEYVG